MHEIAGRRIPPEFTIEPYTDHCREICERGEHALIGVSPGNGYFNEQRLTALLRWASSVFDEVDPVIPDASLTHTYRALGWDPERVRISTQRETRRLRRRIARAWVAAEVPSYRHRVRVLSEFTEHPAYRSLLRRIEQVVAEKPRVRNVFRQASGLALASHLKGVEPSERQLEVGMGYLIAELPVCADTPAILGVPSSVHIYHHMIPTMPLMFEELFASPGQAFAVVRPADAAPPSAPEPGVTLPRPRTGG
ncbi:tRNA-dependent cyclodipeptide synthase [Streptomyces sp. NPDC127033]|uniref:tRNA-dependent cyclodipeptide synthase n=1 Tax=Streptomyces sp. NPDC127033 TaxID=3347110 RepID=UPI00365C4DFD